MTSRTVEEMLRDRVLTEIQRLAAAGMAAAADNLYKAFFHDRANFNEVDFSLKLALETALDKDAEKLFGVAPTQPRYEFPTIRVTRDVLITSLSHFRANIGAAPNSVKAFFETHPGMVLWVVPRTTQQGIVQVVAVPIQAADAGVGLVPEIPDGPYPTTDDQEKAEWAELREFLKQPGPFE